MCFRRGLLGAAGLAVFSAAASAQYVGLDLSGFNGAMSSISNVEVLVNSTNVAFDGQYLDGPLTSGTSGGDLWFAQYTSIELQFSQAVIVSLSQQHDFNLSATSEDAFWLSAEGGSLSVADNAMGELSNIDGDGSSNLSFSYTGLSGSEGTEADRANDPWQIQSTAITSLTIYFDGVYAGNRGALNIAITTVPAPAGAASLAGVGLLGLRRRRR